MPADFTNNDYTVGWICALQAELAASQAMLDEEHPDLLQAKNDTNAYTLGRIGQHNVVLACLPSGTTGISAATTAARDLLRSFPRWSESEAEHRATLMTIHVKISALEMLWSAARKVTMVREELYLFDHF
jgi:hypothetical protein